MPLTKGLWGKKLPLELLEGEAGDTSALLVPSKPLAQADSGPPVPRAALSCNLSSNKHCAAYCRIFFKSSLCDCTYCAEQALHPDDGGE